MSDCDNDSKKAGEDIPSENGEEAVENEKEAVEEGDIGGGIASRSAEGSKLSKLWKALSSQIGTKIKTRTLRQMNVQRMLI